LGAQAEADLAQRVGNIEHGGAKADACEYRSIHPHVYDTQWRFAQAVDNFSRGGMPQGVYGMF